MTEQITNFQSSIIVKRCGKQIWTEPDMMYKRMSDSRPSNEFSVHPPSSSFLLGVLDGAIAYQNFFEEYGAWATICESNFLNQFDLESFISKYVPMKLQVPAR